MLYNGVDTSIAKSRYTTLLPTPICTTGTFLQFWCLGRVYPFIHRGARKLFSKKQFEPGGRENGCLSRQQWYILQLFLEAEWAIDSEPMRAKGIIVTIILVLVKSKQWVKNIETKTTLASKMRFSSHCFGFQSRRYQWAITSSLAVAQPIRTQNC